MDGWMKTWGESERSERQRGQKTRIQRTAHNTRLKCNVLERDGEKENPGQVMQSEASAMAECGKNKDKEKAADALSIASLMISFYSPF